MGEPTPAATKQSRRTVYLWIAFVISSAATIFDAVSSWQIISVDPIALEGNPIWNWIAHALGFGGAMIFRAVAGIALLGALLLIGLRYRRARGRKIASFGLYFGTAVLILLSAYHIWFRFTYG